MQVTFPISLLMFPCFSFFFIMNLNVLNCRYRFILSLKHKKGEWALRCILSARPIMSRWETFHGLMNLFDEKVSPFIRLSARNSISCPGASREWRNNKCAHFHTTLKLCLHMVWIIRQRWCEYLEFRVYFSLCSPYLVASKTCKKKNAHFSMQLQDD